MSTLGVHVRLKYVDTVDFRKSEATNYHLLPEDVRKSLKEGDAVCFKSNGGDQVVFVLKPRSTSGQEVIASLRLRLPKHRTWNPLMLGEYAAEVGLELVNVKRLYDHLLAPPKVHAEEESP